MLDDLEFKKFVIEKLSSIDDRLSSLESGLDGLSGFAEGFADNLNLDEGSLDQLRGTLSALSAPMMSSMGQSNSGDAEDILESLNEFRDRVCGIRKFMEEQGFAVTEEEK